MEVFDLSSAIQQQIGTVTYGEIIDSVKPAIAKLQRIISNEGTSNGERLKPSYLAQLMGEQITGIRFSKKCESVYKKKRHVAFANASL